MQIFLDSAELNEVRHWLSQGVIDGVTTNPSIMLKDRIYDLEEGARRLSAFLGQLPLSVEVTSNNQMEMVEQARWFASWGPNIVVKIPVVNEYGDSCLGVISALTKQKIAVNATAILSFNQALLAAKAGATYVSIFAGRVADEGNDANLLIRNVRTWLEMWNLPAKIIVGSIRTVLDVQSAALAGTHVVTIPPQFLPKMIDHKYTRETVRQFNQDAAKAMSEIEKMRNAAVSAD